MYVEIREINNNYDKHLITFLKKEGNEVFIEKLKSTVYKFPKILFTLNYIIIFDDLLTIEKIEEEVKNKQLETTYIIYDKAISSDLINDATVEDFISSFKDRRYFK